MLGFVKVDFGLISHILGLRLDGDSKPISYFSSRNCVGERLDSFVLNEELANSGDQVSFRHVTAVFAQESLITSDSLSSVVVLMAEEDTRSGVSDLTRVDWTTGEPCEDPTGAIMRRDPVIDEVKEVTAEPASGEPSGATGEPSSGSGKKPAVKKMPKRPAAKLMPRKKLLKVKSETASGTRQVVPGKNLFKNRETKRRQKEKWIKIQKSAKEERAMPAPPLRFHQWVEQDR